MTYDFDKSRHIHTLDGKNLYGVTTVLSVIAKPALIQWSANMAVDYIKDNITMVPTTWAGLFEEAKKAHRKKKEDAGQKGTDVHALCEEIVKQAIANGGYITEKYAGDNKQVENFVNWAIESKVKFIESEKHVYSEQLWVGGICDLILEIDGKRYLGDIKTSSGIYNEAFFQCGAYELCLIDMGEPKVDAYLVINLKKDGKFDLKMAENREINKDAFKAALALHKIITNLE